MHEPIRLHEKLAAIADQWTPKIVAQLNDCEFKLAKIEGEFVWHSHADTDEAFLVIDGEMEIEFRDGTVALKPGYLYVVPRNVMHRPRAERECHILLVERAGTVNTGDAGGDLTAENDAWI